MVTTMPFVKSILHTSVNREGGSFLLGYYVGRWQREIKFLIPNEKLKFIADEFLSYLVLVKSFNELARL